MNARTFIEQHGTTAIGRTIHTQRIGGYPGGPAIVTEIFPDKNAPEIVMMVKHPTWKMPESNSHEIGIFEHEDVELLK